MSEGTTRRADELAASIGARWTRIEGLQAEILETAGSERDTDDPADEGTGLRWLRREAAAERRAAAREISELAEAAPDAPWALSRGPGGWVLRVGLPGLRAG